MSAPNSLPPAVKVVVGSEALERLAFHGLCAVLVLYLNEHLLYAERDARGVFHLFLAAAYLAPVAGRMVADRLGRLRAVRWGWALHLAGLAVLAAAPSRDALAVGLLLVAAGAGGAMPGAAGLLGDQLRGAEGGAPGRARGALYRAVQGASLLAKLAAPALLVASGPRAALAAAAAAAAASLALVRAGRRAVAEVPPSAPDPHGFVRVVSRAVARLGTGHPGQHWLELARDAHPPEAVAGARAVLRLAPVFAALALFWALFDQRASAWVLQARQLDLGVGGHALSPAQLQALNPLLVFALVPLLGRAVFPALARRGIAVPPLRRVSIGLFATAASFVAAAALQVAVDGGATPHALWQLPQYVLLTAGEVLVSVTGLELAYAQAPAAMRGTIMSIGFLTVFAGNLLTAAVSELFRLDGAGWYGAFAALGLAAALGFRAVTRGWAAAPADAGAAVAE